MKQLFDWVSTCTSVQFGRHQLRWIGQPGAEFEYKSGVIAFLLAAIAGTLELSAPPDFVCPEVAKVRAGLSDLGVDFEGRDGTADWTQIDGQVHLRIKTARTGTAALERDFAAGSCDELAQILALSIERATSPIGLGQIEREGVSLARPVESAPERGWGVDVHGGFRVLRSSHTQYGGEAGIEVSAPFSGPFAAALTVGGALPTGYESTIVDPGGRRLSLDTAHLDGALGLALRIAVGSRAFLGLSGAFLVDWLRGSPGIALPSARDLRQGFRGAFWFGLHLGGFELRIEPALRLLESVRFTATPSYEVDFPGVEGSVTVALGWAQ